MKSSTGGWLLARTLRAHGVRHVFSLSGDLLIPFYDACLDEDLHVLDFRHEQAAVHAAEGWARSTGEPGVAAVTAGPGITNTITALANAFQSGSPLLLIGGRRPLAEADRGGFGEQEAVSLVAPVTKWSRTVHQAARIPEYVGRGLHEARSGRPGPVFLEIPSNLLEEHVSNSTQIVPLQRARPSADPALVEEAASLLRQAERPMVLAGSGVWWAQAWDQLRALVEDTQTPLCAVHLGRGAVPEDHPLCLGPFKSGLKEADTVLLLGAKLNWTLDFGNLINPAARIVQVDVHEPELGRNRTPEVALCGDLRLVLEHLRQAIAAQGRPDRSLWLRRLHELRGGFLSRLEEQASSNASPVHPLRLCRELAGYLGQDFTLSIDGGEIQIWAAMALRVYKPGRWLDSGAFACLGTGLPFALGARLARPDERILLLTGDGSFGFSGMEIDTAVRRQLPVVTVIANDGAWGMIKHMQEHAYGSGRVVGTELGWVRYDRMAEALGAHGEFVERPEEIAPAMDRAFSSGRAAVVNVKCDPNVESPFGQRFLAAGG